MATRMMRYLIFIIKIILSFDFFGRLRTSGARLSSRSALCCGSFGIFIFDLLVVDLFFVIFAVNFILTIFLAIFVINDRYSLLLIGFAACWC